MSRNCETPAVVRVPRTVREQKPSTCTKRADSERFRTCIPQGAKDRNQTVSHSRRAHPIRQDLRGSLQRIANYD
jgi:hypothetical protein